MGLHILVAERIRKKKDGNGIVTGYDIITDVYASIIDANSIQEASVVSAILKSVVSEYKKANPVVQRIFLRSDQAGISTV